MGPSVSMSVSKCSLRDVARDTFLLTGAPTDYCFTFCQPLSCEAHALLKASLLTADYLLLTTDYLSLTTYYLLLTTYSR